MDADPQNHGLTARLLAQLLVPFLIIAPDGAAVGIVELAFLASCFALLLLVTGADRLAGHVARVPPKGLRAVATIVLLSPGVWAAYSFTSHAASLWFGFLACVAVVPAAVAVTLRPKWFGLADVRNLSATILLGAMLMVVAHFVAHGHEATLDALGGGNDMLRVGVFVATWVGAIGLTLVFAACAQVTDGEQKPKLLILVGAVVGIGLAIIDRTQFSGLYEGFHVWLAFAAGVSLLLPVTSLTRIALGRVGRPSMRWAALAMLGALCLVAPVLPQASEPAFRASLSDAVHSETALRFREAAPLQNFARAELEHLGTDLFHEHRSERTGKLDIVVISIDTLRADYVGRQAAHGEHAPVLATLADESLFFRSAYTTGPRTAMGMGCFLLGQYSANLEWNLWIWRNGKILNPEHVTPAQLKGKWGYTTVPTFPEGGGIAERVKAAGYTTIAHPYAHYAKFFHPGIGFERGFDTYEIPKIRKQPSSAKVLDIAFEAFDAHKKAAPTSRVYHWIHLFDPHEANAKPKRYAELVKVTDTALGEFFDRLRKAGYWDETAILVVSDHGEAMDEHGFRFHGHSLYDEQVRVPMIVRIPGVAPQAIDGPATILDVSATAVALAGGSLDGLDGMNLLGIADGRVYPDRFVFTEMHRYRGKSGVPNRDGKAVLHDGWKLIWDRKGGWFRLFDLKADPSESHDRFASEPARAQLMLETLVSFVAPREARHPLPGPSSVAGELASTGRDR